MLLLVPTAVAALVVVAAATAQVGEGKGREGIRWWWVPLQVVNNLYFLKKIVNNL